MPSSKGSVMSNGVPKSFEQKLERIDAIVRELEGGKVELDRAIELFKEGKVLARECEVILRGAQDQVDQAMKDSPQS